MPNCVFCKKLPKILENDLAYAVYDINPIAKGHMVFVTKRHHGTLFESTPQEIQAVFDLISQAKRSLDREHKPGGYNLQANCGKSAGQIVMHAHIHLIPRYAEI
ncbi:MAG: HIT family protein [Candidatus Omnitrophica bacterium]|nr:HIT family protein [Candidatus Omnitrophota bacterium]